MAALKETLGPCGGPGLRVLYDWMRYSDHFIGQRYSEEWSSRSLRRSKPKGIVELMAEQLALELDREILEALIEDSNG